MSISLTQHTNRLRFDAASYPASLHDFTIAMFVKVSTLPAAGTYQQLLYLQGTGGASGNYLFINSDGAIRGGSEWGANETGNVAVIAPNGTDGLGWAFVALRGTGTGASGMRVSVKLPGQAMATAALAFNSGVTTFEDMMLGSTFADGEYGITTFKGKYAHVKVWDVALSDDELLSEAVAGAPVVTTDLLHHRAMTTTPISSALSPTTGSGVLAILAGGVNPATSTDNPTFGGTQPTVTIDTTTIVGQAVTVSGELTSAAGTPAVAVQLLPGASGTTQGPASATIDGTDWTITFAGVPAGVYTPRATVTDANGAAQDSDAVLEIVGLSGAGVLPHLYAAGSVVVTPEAASLSVSGTQVLTVVDANGLPLDGVVFTSSAPAVATVTSPSSSLGQVTVTGVAAGTATIQAAFSDPVGGTLSDSVAISVALLVPAAPTGLTAVALGSNRVRLAWTDNSSNETQFRIERAPASTGPWTQILTPSSNTVTADDTTVTPGATYFYRVRSANADGPSDPSNVASIAVPAGADTTPPTVTLSSNSTSVTVDNSSIVLSAQAEDNVGVTEVRFYRDGQQLGPMLTAPNAGALYQVTQFFSGSAGNGTPVLTARAWDAAGNSTLSAPVVVSVNIPATGVAPVAPSGLTASLVTQSGCRLTWTDNSTNETAFLLERRVLPGGVWEQVQVLGADATQYDVTGLLANTGYGFRLRAQGSQLPSGYSNEVVITTLAAGATGLAALSVTPDTVSAMPGEVSVITVTALNGNGSSRPGVTITPTIATAAIAVVAPVNAITDASGKASFTITFGATVGQTAVTFVGNDGVTSVAPPATPAVQLFTLPSITEALIKELQAEQTDPKYSEEITPLVWDFSEWMGRGEVPTSIESREVVPVGGQDRDPSSSAMLFGAARIVGVRVLQYVRDGLPGVSYYLRCKVRTNLGRVAVAEYRMRVYRGTGSRVSSGTSVVD